MIAEKPNLTRGRKHKEVDTYQFCQVTTAGSVYYADFTWILVEKNMGQHAGSTDRSWRGSL